MNSWLAWGYKVCGNEAEYNRLKTRIEEALGGDPYTTDPGLAYLLALDGDTDGLVDLLTRVVDRRSPFTVFVQIFSLDYLGWDVADSLPADPRYQALLERVGFPSS